MMEEGKNGTEKISHIVLAFPLLTLTSKLVHGIGAKLILNWEQRMLYTKIPEHNANRDTPWN